jgi:tetratricopeptide (TPR) repeat protein
MGSLALEQKDYERARGCYERALVTFERVYTVAHPKSAAAMFGLAVLYQRQRDFEHAESLYQRLLEIDTHIEIDAADRLDHLTEYALLLRETHRKSDAKLVEASAASLKHHQLAGVGLTVDVNELGARRAGASQRLANR